MKLKSLIFAVFLSGSLNSAFADVGSARSQTPGSPRTQIAHRCDTVPVDKYLDCITRYGIPRGLAKTKQSLGRLADAVGCDSTDSENKIKSCVSSAVMAAGPNRVMDFFSLDCARLIFREESDFLRCTRLQNTNRSLRRTVENRRQGVI